MDYPNAKFLVYSSWEKEFPYKITGSLLLGGALTEEEAKEKINLYKARQDEFNAKFPGLSDTTKKSFTYITNRPEWWSGSIQ